MMNEKRERSKKQGNIWTITGEYMAGLMDEAYSTLGELIRMHELNLELLETLQVTMLWLREYTKKQGIPLPNMTTFDSLVNKAQALLEELREDTPLFPKHRKLSDEFSQKKASDEDFTEP